MDVLITQLKNAAIKADATGRKKVIDTLRELTYSLESSEDTMQRIMFLVSFLSSFPDIVAATNSRAPQNLQIASVRIGINLKLFETLAGSVDPMTLDQLIAKTGADSVLLGKSWLRMASTSSDSCYRPSIEVSCIHRNYQRDSEGYLYFHEYHKDPRYSRIPGRHPSLVSLSTFSQALLPF